MEELKLKAKQAVRSTCNQIHKSSSGSLEFVDDKDCEPDWRGPHQSRICSAERNYGFFLVYTTKPDNFSRTQTIQTNHNNLCNPCATLAQHLIDLSFLMTMILLFFAGRSLIAPEVCLNCLNKCYIL